MPFFKTDDLKDWTAGEWLHLNANSKPEIHGFSTDSRNIEKNFAFVAIKAERDGHDFAQNAIDNNATAIIAERDLGLDIPTLVVKDTLKAFQRIAKLHRLRYENIVVGITGSCGKTSTKEILTKLCAWKRPISTEKNYNNEIGVPLTLTKIDLRQNQLAIVEAGVAAPNQMQELAEMIEPDIAIVTNVGLTHLEKFEQVSNVAKEKSILPLNVAKDGWCLMHQKLLSWKVFDELQCKKAVVAPADAPDFNADLIFRYSIIELDENKIAIDMGIEYGDDYYFEVQKMSDGMIENTVLSIAASLMLGAKEENIYKILEKIQPLPMRGTVLSTDTSTYYIDCYNASPTSMKDALSHFAEISKDSTKRTYVLGTMAELGLSAHPHHKDIGSHIQPYESDTAILIGTFADVYKKGMLENGWDEKNIKVLETAEQAKEILNDLDGYIFVKGSRVCKLENSLPNNILEIMSIVPPTVEEESEQIEEEESQEINIENNENIDDEDNDDEQFDDDDDFQDDDDDNEFNDNCDEDDDEDERNHL